MPPSLLELAKELTFALIQTGNLLTEDVQETLRKTHKTLTALKAQEATGAPGPTLPAETPPKDWRQSITRYSITCLECGQAFKQLSVRHLRQHGLDARSYRTKYAIPRNVPLAARDTTTRRRQLVQTTRPWEKAPAYLRGQARKIAASPEPEVEIVHEETEAASAARSTQPKRQRKASPKKTARKTTAQG